MLRISTKFTKKTSLIWQGHMVHLPLTEAKLLEKKLPIIKLKKSISPQWKQLDWPRWDIILSWGCAYPIKIKIQKRWAKVVHHKNLIMGRRR